MKAQQSPLKRCTVKQSFGKSIALDISCGIDCVDPNFDSYVFTIVIERQAESAPKATLGPICAV
jgi:hypothetical protein